MDNRRQEIKALSALLDFEIPAAYEHFLATGTPDTVNGLPMFGLPVSPELSSPWGATELLRALRPDLVPKYLVIRFMDTRALCLDLTKRDKDDAPLVEINLKSTESAKRVHRSFSGYLNDGVRNARRVRGAIRRINGHLYDKGQMQFVYDHEKGAKSKRAHHWKVIRSCVHDLVVGLAAIKHNETHDCLEVDVFISTAHAQYESTHGIRGLLILLLSDAFRNGGSMEIRFTRKQHEKGPGITRHERVAERVPYEVIKFASDQGIKLSRTHEGIVEHLEAIRLFAAAVGLDATLISDLIDRNSCGRITIEGLSYLIGSNLWGANEVAWLVSNFTRPEGILYGLDTPENRLLYLESLRYGRAALIASKMIDKLRIQENAQDGECISQIVGLLWNIETKQRGKLDWSLQGDAIQFEESRKFEVLARPRPCFPTEHSDVLNDVKLLLANSSDDNNALKCILYASDHRECPDIKKLAHEVSDRYQVTLLSAPFSCSELDQELDPRMAKARSLRS